MGPGVKSINLLYIGSRKFEKEIVSNLPKTWNLICVERLKEFRALGAEIDIILDASIIDIINLDRDEFKKVKIIGCASTGTNHIKLSGSASRNIKVYSLKETPELLRSMSAAAEFSFLLLMALARNFVPAIDSVKNGEWDRLKIPGSILKGKTLGLIGFGRIGSAMATYAEIFGMTVVFYDPFLKLKPKKILEHNSIEKLVAYSDFVSLHVPYTDELFKRPLINKEIFASFKTGSYFINTSRGELIDEDALITQLKSGKIKGAALDVLINEPNIHENQIYKYAQESGANVILTPHIAGYAVENVKIATLGMLDYLVRAGSEHPEL